MKTLTILFLLFSTALQTDLASIRANFQKSEGSEEHADALYNSLKDYNDTDPLLKAYKGAAFAMQAHHAKKISDKKKFFVEGAENIEAAVAADSDNVEIRLVRLAIQENTPRIVRYKKNMDEDKQMILTNFAKQSKTVQDLVKHYASQRSEVFTAEELSKLSN